MSENLSTFHGLPEELPWIEFVKKMGNDSDALNTFADAVADATSTSIGTLEDVTVTGSEIADGLTASGTVANDYSGSTGAFKTSTGLNTFGGKAAFKVIATPVAAATSPAALGSANIVYITSDGATKGVTLPVGAAGDIVYVINTSGTAAKLLPSTGGTINGLSANAAVVIAASKGCICICSAAITWLAFDTADLATTYT